MPHASLYRLPLAEMAARLASGALSPLALAEHYLTRIDALDPALGAFTAVTRERALTEAKAAETALRAGCPRSPLHGIPFAVKHSIDVLGLPSAHGLVHSTTRAGRDAGLVRRLSAAGMVLLGKTRTNDFMSGGAGINLVDGTARNPWHGEPYLPGGSSSGSAVAVAAGLVPVAVGTDTGGSVRIPAALCGVVGLRPPRGRIDGEGVLAQTSRFDTPGPITRRVEDALWLYRILRGDTDPGTSRDAIDPDVTGLRILPAEPGGWLLTNPAVQAATQAAWTALARRGARVVPAPLPEFAEIQALRPAAQIGDVDVLIRHGEAIEPVWEQLNPVARAALEAARQVSASDHIAAMRGLDALVAELPRRWRDTDALVMSTCLQPAVLVSESDPDAKTAERVRTSYELHVGFASALNLASLTVPCGATAEGLPVGAMVCALPEREAMVFRIGAALQDEFRRAEQWPELGWAVSA